MRLDFARRYEAPAASLSPMTDLEKLDCLRDYPRIRVGPLQPTRIFPPVLFSTAIDLATKICGDPVLNQPLAQGNSAELTFISCLQAAFDLVRAPEYGFDGRPSTMYSYLSATGDRYFFLELPNGIIIDPFMGREIFLGSQEEFALRGATELCRVGSSEIASKILTSIEQAVKHGVRDDKGNFEILPSLDEKDRALPLIVAEFLRFYRNSSYTPMLEDRRRGRRRFEVIDTIHALDTDSSAAERLLKFADRAPMVLLRRGWCGGTVLHEAVSYSNHMLVEEVIKRLRMVLDENLSKGANASAKVSLAEMVNAQNREGSTPLHFAVQLGDRETAEALVAAGARRDLADRFGRYPLPKLSGTDLQKIIQPVSVTGANAAQFIELFAAAFSGTQHLHTRAVAIDLINQHVRGEKRLLVEGHPSGSW